MKLKLLLLLLATLGIQSIGLAQFTQEYHPEYKNVEQAIYNYVDALYNADSTLIVESVDPSLRKLGYWLNPESGKFVDNLPMSYNKLVSLAARWNADGNQTNEESPREIAIFDIQSKTASAKLTAEWGVDYFHLAKVDGEWKIYNVIWQSLEE